MDADVTENAGTPPEPDNPAADGRQSETPGAADSGAMGSPDQKSADSGDHLGVEPDDALQETPGAQARAEPEGRPGVNSAGGTAQENSPPAPGTTAGSSPSAPR